MKDSTAEREKIIIRTSVIGILTNIMLASFKATVGLITNSIAIILDAVKDYDYPVAFDFPSGHEEQNHALIFGATYTLSVTKKGGTLKIAKNVQLV